MKRLHLWGAWRCSPGRASPPQIVGSSFLYHHRAFYTQRRGPPRPAPEGKLKITLFSTLTFAFNDRGRKRRILVANDSKDGGQRRPRTWFPVASSEVTRVFRAGGSGKEFFCSQKPNEKAGVQCLFPITLCISLPARLGAGASCLPVFVLLSLLVTLSSL